MIDLDKTYRGYHFIIKNGSPDCHVTISKDENVIREFDWPAYKIFNILAHIDDIVDGLEQDSNIGFLIAS